MKGDERVFLGAYWKDRSITGKEFVQLCHDFLARLRKLSSAFGHRCVAIPEGSKFVAAAVPEDYESFERLMMRAVPNPEIAYLNPDRSNKNFTLQSTTAAGFTIGFSDGGYGTTQPTRLSVSITAGVHAEYQTPNSVIINIPPDYREFWQNSDMARHLMEIVVSVWRPTFATVTSSELRRALDPGRTGRFALGPIAYFADKRAGSAAEGTARVEPSVHGGVFLSIDTPYPWTGSLGRLRPCYSRLNDAGLLQWHVSEVSAW
jgi:hypothetical protein